MLKLNVMIVEDSIIMIRSITKLLESVGHTVVASARNGREALKLYPQKKPDIVTMDITMPDMDGVETTRQLMELDPFALVIMVTSHGQEQMVIDSLTAGAKGYVLKPIEAGQLCVLIENVYEKYRK